MYTFPSVITQTTNSIVLKNLTPALFWLIVLKFKTCNKVVKTILRNAFTSVNKSYDPFKISLKKQIMLKMSHELTVKYCTFLFSNIKKVKHWISSYIPQGQPGVRYVKGASSCKNIIFLKCCSLSHMQCSTKHDFLLVCWIDLVAVTYLCVFCYDRPALTSSWGRSLKITSRSAGAPSSSSTVMLLAVVALSIGPGTYRVCWGPLTGQ